MHMNNFAGKQFLAAVRGSDFAHAGEAEAIELVFAGVVKDSQRSILDAGCGRGGTADYVRRGGWGEVIGLDLEEQSIEYARSQYPHVEFHSGDICDAGQKFPSRFELIYLFNVFYAIADKAQAMLSLRDCARSAARLCFFDYVTYKPEIPVPAVMLSGVPATLSQLDKMLSGAGWKLDERINLDEKYIEWYRSLISRFDDRRLLDQFPPERIESVRQKYEELLCRLVDGTIGGVLLYASAV